jgi:hypothetical protein
MNTYAKRFFEVSNTLVCQKIHRREDLPEGRVFGSPLDRSELQEIGVELTYDILHGACSTVVRECVLTR